MQSIQDFIGGLCGIDERNFKEAQVSRYLQDNPVDPVSNEPYLFWEPTHYTRNLIYKCPIFELMAICWEIGQVSRIHNHAGQSCWMTVPIGRLAVQNYEVVRLDEAHGYCELREAGRVLMDPAHPTHVDPDMPVHAVLNPAEYGQRAASLHIYSRPYDRCLVYDMQKRSYCEVPLFYDSEYGQRLAVPQ